MKIILILFIVVLIGVGGLYFTRNILVESAVEKSSSFALRVDTDLSSARLEFSGGTLELNGFEVSNPDGYETDNFLVIDNILLDVKEGSLLDDELIVDSFVIDGIEINFEQLDSKGNYQEILNNIKKLEMSSSESGEQKFIINKLSFKNISVNTLYNMVGNKGKKNFEVDDFTLKNVGGSNGVNIGEITAIIVKKITVKAISANFPTKKYIKELGDKAGEALKEVTGESEDKIKELGKSLLGK